MATSFLGGVFATSTPFPVGACTDTTSLPINTLQYTVNDGQTACPNLNSSTLCRITVNVTSLTPGLFNASIPKGLCSVGQTVYTNDSLPAITGSRGLITIVYIPTSGLTTTVRIAYAFSGIYLSSSDHIAVNSSDPPPLDYIWEVYGVTGSTVLCQLESDGRLTDAPATLIPFDTPSPTCIYVAPYVKATRLTLTSKMQPVAPGNYTLVLTNDTCTSPFLLRSPPLFYTVLPGNSAASTAVTITSPSPTDNSGAIIGGIFGILAIAAVVVVVVVVALAIKSMRAKGALKVNRGTEPVVPVPAQEGDTTSSALLLVKKKSPWLENFSQKLADLNRGTSPYPLLEGCTTEMLIDKLKDARYSTVYLVLNEPSEELIRAIDEPSFPTNTQHKLVVVELDSSAEAGGGLHRNVTWIPCPPDIQAEECAMRVCSSIRTPDRTSSGAGSTNQGNPAVGVAATAESKSGQDSLDTHTEVLKELGHLSNMVRHVSENVFHLVDNQQQKKLDEI
eukprot:Em0023g442a